VGCSPRGFISAPSSGCGTSYSTARSVCGGSRSGGGAPNHCAGQSRSPSTEQIPPRARLTARLQGRIVSALSGEVRAVSRVAVEVGVSWPTAMRQLTLTRVGQVVRAAARPALVTNLDTDEHRFRTVRWYQDDDHKWRRIEPWMTTFTDLATGFVIGVVDGRDSAAVQSWLKTSDRPWRHSEARFIDPVRSAVCRSGSQRRRTPALPQLSDAGTSAVRTRE